MGLHNIFIPSYPVILDRETDNFLCCCFTGLPLFTWHQPNLCIDNRIIYTASVGLPVFQGWNKCLFRITGEPAEFIYLCLHMDTDTEVVWLQNLHACFSIAIAQGTKTGRPTWRLLQICLFITHPVWSEIMGPAFCNRSSTNPSHRLTSATVPWFT